MQKAFLFLSILIVTLLYNTCLRAAGIMLNGQASAWTIYNAKWRAGVRYIPELRKVLAENIDAEISLNMYSFDKDSDLKLYRSWVRYTLSQFDMRLGLQKINFGPGKVLRSLMWFDRLDERDPLQLTDGVYALLGRYYFLNNANIWIWGLYGNDDLKGLEVFKTSKDNIELGGRFQIPVPRGELALSFNRRYVDKKAWNSKMTSLMSDGAEDRYGIDGVWDIGPGLWFEAVSGEIRVTGNESLWQGFLTAGTDYTFSIGTGIHILYEHFIKTAGAKIDKQSNVCNLSAVSADFKISILDSLNAIGYYDWKEEKTYTFLGLQRTYDNWLINLSVFSSHKEESLYNGNGVQIMLTFNH